MSIQWYGYQHVNGTFHLKRYFSPEDISECHESPFVKLIFGPWEVNNRDEAYDMLKKELISIGC